jgi:undecaprenyl-diphosphatase
MLSSRGRSAIIALVLLLGATGLVAAVGRGAPGSAPASLVQAVGRWDGSVDARIREIRTDFVVDASKALDLLGGSLVLVPFRVVILVLLAALRRFSGFSAFALTWAITQPSTELMKGWLHRGRPPGPLVDVTSFAMPSGHTVAFASIAVAAAIAFATGPWRGGLVIAGFGAGALMGASRLVLSAHWLSDVVVGVLFGGGIAIASAVVVDAIAERMPERLPIRLGRG